MSGAVPPPAARPLERAARVPQPVCPGCGRCGRVDPAPAPQRAPLRAGVARCGGGGRASPGGVPSAVVRGAWCQALSLPRPPVLWSGQPRFRCACVFVCVLCLAGSGGPASRARSGAPHLFLWPLCLSALLGPLRAGVAPLSLAAAAFPRCRRVFFFFFFFFFFFSFFFFFPHPLPGWLVSPAWPLAARWWLLPRPPPLVCPAVLVAPAWCLGVVFFFFFFFFLPVLLSLCAPVVSGFLWFPAPVALGRGACVVCFVGPPCACSSFVLSAWLLAAPSWLLPPPPLLFRAVLCCAWLGAALRRAAARCAARWCAVLCCVALVWCRCLLRRALWRCPLPWGPVLCGAVFCGAPPRCVLCAVCVLPWRGGACCCSPLCFVLCVSRGAVLCVPCALRSPRCCASLCWCARVVLFVWCVPLLAPGAVVRCCVLCCFLWCAVVRCWVCWPVVVCWWRVSGSVSLSGRVVCFPVVGVVCCGALLSCVVFCGAVLSRGAVLLLSAVVLRCCWGLLCPSVGCRAVLCCAVGWLCCFLPGGGVCAVWCSFPRALVPCCHVVPWCPVLSPCWVRFLRGCGCTYL